MSTFAQQYAMAQDAFRNLPAKMIESWLKDRVKEGGWPPASPKWIGFLRYRSLSEWDALTWRMQTITFSFADFNPDSRRIIQGLVDAHINEKRNEFRGLSGSKERFCNAFVFAKEHGHIPGVLALLRESDSWDIVDGCHRLSALRAFKTSKKLSNLVSSEFSAWVGEPGITNNTSDGIRQPADESPNPSM